MEEELKKPMTDQELDREMGQLVVRLGQVFDDMKALIRRASLTRQLPVLQRGMVQMRAAVELMARTVQAFAPPFDTFARWSRQQAKTVRFTDGWSPPKETSTRQIFGLEELMEMTEFAVGRVQIVKMLKELGVEEDYIARLDQNSRVRLLLNTQALHASLLHDGPLTAEPAAMKKWPEGAPDYAASDIAFSLYANQPNANSDHIMGAGVDFGGIMLQPRRLTQNETGRKSAELEQAKQLVEDVFKAWPEMREYVKNASIPLEFPRATLETWSFSRSIEDRKKIVSLLKDRFGVHMSMIVRMSAPERVDWILAFQASGSAGLSNTDTVKEHYSRVSPYAGCTCKLCAWSRASGNAERGPMALKVLEEQKVQYHTYNREDKVLMVKERVCSCPGCSRERAAAEADALSFRPTPRVKRDVVTRLQQETPVVSKGMGFCSKHFTGYTGYCKDCHPEGDPSVKRRVCAYCGNAAQGEFAIHRDGFGEGPEVDLCNGCGGCDETVLSCETIWEKFAKDGVCQ